VGTTSDDRHVAERIVAVTPASTVLVVGCAEGLLVRGLVDSGVDAHGIDVSEPAIESADHGVRDRLRVASATEPIPGRYDLITCLEVLEHLGPTEAQDALDAMGAATARILVSSSNPQWSGWFADRGFYRRTDVDLGFLSARAVLFERSQLTPREVVARYEELIAPLGGGTPASRDVSLADQREQVARWEAEVLTSRHQMLVNRDHIIGVEAELGRANRDLVRTAKELSLAQRRVRRLTDRRDELREKLGALRKRATASQRQSVALRRRVRELEGEVARAQTGVVRRLARGVRRRLS
jgi:hypothetical protein